MSNQKDILVSSSVCLIKDANGNYFVQIILDENEYDGRNRADVFMPITQKQAVDMSNRHNMKIIKEGDVINTTDHDVITDGIFKAG